MQHLQIKKNLLGPGLALVNPFNPRITSERMTENRRRWTHVFSQVRSIDSILKLKRMT